MSSQQTEPSSRDIYETVIGFVDHNTGGPQPPLTHEPAVIASVSRSYPDEHPARVRSAISAATSRGDLLRYVDDSGEHDRILLGIDDAYALGSKIRRYHERSERTTRNGAIALQIATKRINSLVGGSDE